MQGTNARKVISEGYAFILLQCTVFGRKSKQDRSGMESIFTKTIYEIFWSLETIIHEFSKLSKLNAF